MLEDERDEYLATIEEMLDKEMNLNTQVAELEENSVWLQQVQAEQKEEKDILENDMKELENEN